MIINLGDGDDSDDDANDVANDVHENQEDVPADSPFEVNVDFERVEKELWKLRQKQTKHNRLFCCEGSNGADVAPHRQKIRET